MPAYELLLPFFAATAVFACIPGPGMFFMAAQTIAHGRPAGWLSALGMHLSGYVHILAAAFGFALLLQAVPLIHLVLKLAGAAYLVWLGLRLILNRGPAIPPESAAQAEKIQRSPKPMYMLRRTFWDSMLVGVLNPKTLLFYFAFLPQFTDPSAEFDVWAQILILGAIVNLMFSITDTVCVLFSDTVAGLFAASRQAGQLARRLGGGVLIALGLSLAASRQ